MPPGRDSTSICDWFMPVQEWMPEDEEDVESTAKVYDLIAELLGQGFSASILIVWEGDDLDMLQDVEVSLAKVPRDHFIFLEGCRFRMIL